MKRSKFHLIVLRHFYKKVFVEKRKKYNKDTSKVVIYEKSSHYKICNTEITSLKDGIKRIEVNESLFQILSINTYAEYLLYEFKSSVNVCVRKSY